MRKVVKVDLRSVLICFVIFVLIRRAKLCAFATERHVRSFAAQLAMGARKWS